MILPKPKEFRDIPIALIEPSTVPAAAHPQEMRDGIEHLMLSIKRFGLLQPVIVCEAPQGRYGLIAGRRRVLACAMLRMTAIKAVVLDQPPDPVVADAIWATENLVRHELNPRDVSAAFATLLMKYGSDDAIAEQTGIPLEIVRRRLGR